MGKDSGGAHRGGKPLHKNYAEDGKVAGVGGTPVSRTRQFAGGGSVKGGGLDDFKSTNDMAHRHHGAPLHYRKTVKMKPGGA